jgi:hypothetical protein
VADVVLLTPFVVRGFAVGQGELVVRGFAVGESKLAVPRGVVEQPHGA